MLYHFDGELIGRNGAQDRSKSFVEELFASGCRLIISVTSSGRIVEKGEPSYFVLIEKALRDEGTSYYYLSPAEYATLASELERALGRAFDNLEREPLVRCTTKW